jgi:hypothetical protein
MTEERLLKGERAWIRYRDAWVDYGTRLWPSTSTDSWRTWLTLERIEYFKMLQKSQ